MRSAPSTLSKTETAMRPITSTSSVVKPRCTSTLSMTTWKNSGETSANSWRKKDATSTSVKKRRYLCIACRNQVTSNRRASSPSEARRASSTSRPLHCAQQASRLHDLRAALHRVVDEGTALGDTAQDEEAAVVALGDRRKLGTRQPLPAAGHDARLELQRLGAAQHLGAADRPAAELMPDLRSIGGKAEESQHQHERFETGISLGFRRTYGNSSSPTPNYPPPRSLRRDVPILARKEPRGALSLTPINSWFLKTILRVCRLFRTRECVMGSIAQL